MDIIVTKVLVASLFGIIRFIFGVLPVKVYLVLKHKAGNRGTSAINDTMRARLEFVVLLVQAFGSGVLFATCFLRMMPEVRESFQSVKEEPTNFPFPQLLISVGFFTTYMIEEVVYWWISRETKQKCQETRKSPTSSAKSIISKNTKIVPKCTKIPRGMAFELEKKEIYDKNENNFEFETEECEKNEKNLEDTVSVNTIADSIDEEVQTENLNDEIEEIVEEEVKTELQILRCFIMVVVISFDTILDGLMIGLQDSVANIWYLFAAVAVHSASVIFCVSLEVQLVGMKEKSTMIQLCLLSGTTSLGVLLGLIISSTTDIHASLKSWTIVVLQGLSTGAILYVTFFESLNREKERRTCRIVRAVSMGVGFTLMALLECLKEDDLENSL